MLKRFALRARNLAPKLNFKKHNYFCAQRPKDNSKQGDYSEATSKLKIPLILTTIGLAGMYFYDKNSKTIDTTDKKAPTEITKNKVECRVETLQYPANDPIEDRFSYHSFESVDGFTAIVFDGHGGSQVAELASNTLHLYLDAQ